MKPIFVRSNWGYWDALGTADLKDGERLRIEWPDGTVTTETIHVDKGTFSYSDHGHESQGPDHKAYVERSVAGALVKVWFRDVEPGLHAERVR
jgi:hypothetical protein